MLRKLKVLIFIIPSILIACSSAESKRIKAEKKQQITDSIRLIYDHVTADTRIDDFMQRLHTRSGLNGNVVVARNGKILHQDSFGCGDHVRRVRHQIDSHYELAASSKPFSAAGIFKVVEQEQIGLKQTVNECIPDFPYEGVSIQQLLSHRSCLPN